MATQRRIISTEKTHLDQDEQPKESNITPAVPGSVIAKLLMFTFAMVTFPIGTYFLTKDFVFRGNSTFAGALAAVVANVVLIGYVIVAFNDDKSEQAAEAEKEKKSR
ncbi:hypothetical protein K461DRAFT_321887 [Myriangium duriaei CBS 260.36]|uniref:Vacuolar ATPase assembly integral membrane protein VMA21 n=1 Tax=Myriangium duriaei CBS 260.36 TaxID=1168546 RepID=A0A9P4J071_9PEZI|nr:hypothetical protein K461DRAFT_321887 [Myriangium duriaei CBS 260.36]